MVVPSWAAAGATLLAVFVAAFYLLWTRTALKFKLERKLQVRVERDPKRAAQRAEAASGPLRFLEVDPTAARISALTGVRLLSLADYFASLRPVGAVSFERVLVSVADRYGLSAALPLALFLPSRWREEASTGGLLRSFPSQAAAALGSTALSTLDLSAFSETVHLYTAGRRRAAKREQQQQRQQGERRRRGHEKDAAQREAEAAQARTTGPLEILLAGRKPPKEGSQGGALPPLPSPLLLSPPGMLALLGLSEADAADTSLAPAPPPRPLSPFLPDLHLGNGGLTLTHSRAGAAICQVMAAVFNRLSANALAGLQPVGEVLARCGQAAPEQPFVVRLREGGEAVSSVEGLLGALREAGHSVELRLSSNLTSFGVGLSVRDPDGSWQQVPLTYPLRCSGLWLSGEDSSGGERGVTTLIPHASIVLEVRGPQLSFELEWCLSIQGFTGWIPYVFVRRDWASGRESRTTHPMGDLAAPGQQRQLARLLTAATCVLNMVSQRDSLLFGGYGHVGVCVDSVAAIQQAMAGSCTLFPLVLGGEAKLSLMAAYRAAQQQAPSWEYAEESAALQQALAALPCDTLQSPQSAADAARRALACLPRTTVFTGVEECRRTLQAALATAEELCPSSN